MSHPTSSFPPASRPPGAAAPAEASDLYRRLHDAESSNRLRGDILQQVSDAVLLIDHEQRVVFLNAAAERRYGRVAADAVGQPLSELYTYRWLSPADEAAALARVLGRKRRPSDSTPEARRKLFQQLMRRGFSPDTIRKVLKGEIDD